MNSPKTLDNATQIINRLTFDHYLELKESGLTDEQILLTGHYSEKSPKSALNKFGLKTKGLIFSYRDPLGKHYSLTDNKIFARVKPQWENKSDDEYADKPPKYLSPEKSGCRPYFSQILAGTWPRIIEKTRVNLTIAEGEKKGDCLCANGEPTIAFGGVDSWVDSTPREGEPDLEESRPLPELSTVNWRSRTVHICYDSDISIKSDVRSACSRLALWLDEKGAQVKIVMLPNEIDGSKNGADDFIVRHGIKAFRTLKSLAINALVGTDDRKFNFKDFFDPPLALKAAMAHACFKEKWAYRPGVGWMEYTADGFWRQQDENFFLADLKQFILANNWQAIAPNHRFLQR